MSKLVRDNIPEIIRQSEKDSEYHIASNDFEFRGALDAKLDEEIDELRHAPDVEHIVEEIADIIEVLLAMAKGHGYTPEQVEVICLEKRTKRGGFEKRIILDRDGKEFF